MLRVESYSEYEQKMTINRSLQLAKYYLSKWGRIENNIANLSVAEKRIAKLLFTSLKQMTAEEREFLASKYRVIIFGKASRTDKEVAEEYKMKLIDYQNLRKGIEYKFYFYLKPLLKERGKK